MSIKVSLQDKFDFVNMLLAKYKFKVRESVRVFTYLLENPHYLKLVHFVNDITNCPRAISLSTTCVLDEPFIFHKANIRTTNGLQAFHDIRLNNDEPIYIKVNFSNQNSREYFAVVVDNPYNIYTYDYHTRHQIKKDKIKLHNERINLLKQQIDKALDDNNKANFDYLVNKLKDMTE